MKSKGGKLKNKASDARCSLNGELGASDVFMWLVVCGYWSGIDCSDFSDG